MSRSVVIALDSSDFSVRALPFARSIAHQWSDQIVLVHAPVRSDHAARNPLNAELSELLRSLSQEGIAADVVVRTAESPAQAIVDVASERDADFIVMASHQRHGLARWLNGSVTEQVLLKTSTPLLVIPAGARSPSTSSLRVLVPLDGSAVGEVPLELLRARSTELPLYVLLVRIVTPGPVVIGLEPTFIAESVSADELKTEVQEAGEYLARWVRTLTDARMAVRSLVLESTEPVERVIRDAADREDVDVIALGTHARSGASRLVLGSVSEEILERSMLPVLLVRQPHGALAESPPAMLRAPLAVTGNGSHG